MSELPEHVAENRRHWDTIADDWVAMGERAWALRVPTWGQWGVSDEECPMLPADMTGMAAIELGCGTGYVSAWMVQRGAEVTAIDNSERQLATAKRLANEHGADITFIHGNAETTGLADESFDFAVSEYGAAIWCDPERWIPEAHRLLRPDGRLVFLGNTPLTIVCTPADGSPVEHELHRSYFDVGRVDWTKVEIDPGGMEFNRPISAWFELFHRVGFVVENYLEPRAPVEATEMAFSVPATWARHHPSEQVWFLRKP